MKQNQSIILFVSSLVFSSSALASIYVNGGGGVTDGTVRYLELGTPQYHSIGEVNGVGQLGIGVDGHWNKLYTALEYGYEWQGFDAGQTATISDTVTGASMTAIQSTNLMHDYYVHAKSGYVYNDTVIAYGLAGVVRGYFNYSDVTGDLGNKPGPEYHTWKTGYRLGVGVSNLVKNHFEWRLEYTFNSYAPIYSVLVDPHGGPNIDYKRTHINLSQVLFGIGYHF